MLPWRPRSATLAGLAAYRTAQEALTNASKHAPGQPVTLSLRFEPGLITVLMDLNMPGCDGVEATRRIRASHPRTQVVVLTTYSNDDSIIGALQAGALGYLTKDATRAEIGRAVLAAAAGQAVLDPEVLRLIAAGRSNREIARALFVSEATVRTHVNRIFAKTGSRDRAQAVRFAYAHGYAARRAS